MTKRGLIVALVGLNLMLAAALLFSLDTLPAAYAQRSGRPGDFAMCTVKVQRDYDAIFVLDQTARKLHAYLPTMGKEGKLFYVMTRDLESDIRRTD
jgi:hypothetical protein